MQGPSAAEGCKPLGLFKQHFRRGTKNSEKWLKLRLVFKQLLSWGLREKTTMTPAHLRVIVFAVVAVPILLAPGDCTALLVAYFSCVGLALVCAEKLHYFAQSHGAGEQQQQQHLRAASDALTMGKHAAARAEKEPCDHAAVQEEQKREEGAPWPCGDGRCVYQSQVRRVQVALKLTTGQSGQEALPPGALLQLQGALLRRCGWLVLQFPWLEAVCNKEQLRH